MRTQTRTLAALSLGFMMVVLDSTAISVAIPAIGRSYAGSLTALQWVTGGYVLALASFLLATGRLADRFGSRTMLMAGVVGFSICSVLCALAPNLNALIVMRFLQGTTGAILGTSCFSLLAHTFTEGTERAKAFATMNFCGSIGASVGPLVGGLLVDTAGWQSIFWLNFPMAACVFLGLRDVAVSDVGVPELGVPGRSKALSFDVPGQLLSVVALGGLAAFLIQGAATGWTSRPSVVAAAVFVIAGLAFVVVEASQQDPMLPPALLRVKSFVATSIACGVWRFSMYGLLFFLSLYFQDVRHFSSRLTGLAFLPVLAAPMLTQPLSGTLSARHGVTIVAGGGFILAALGAALIATAPHGSYGFIGLGLGIIGLGGGFAMPVLGQASLADVPKLSLGVASGVFNALGQTGSLIGIAILGALGGGGNASSFHIAGLVVMAVFVGGAVVLAIGAPKTRQAPDSRQAGVPTKMAEADAPQPVLQGAMRDG